MNWKWRALTSVGSVSLALWLFWLGWTHLGPRKPEVGPMRKQVAEQILPQIVEDIREARKHAHTAALLHLGNDPSDFLTNELRSRIEKSGIVDLRDHTFLEKVRNVLNLRHPSFSTMAEAMDKGEAFEVDAVLFGTINRFESGPDGAILDLDLTVAGIDPPQPLLTKRYNHTIPVGYISKVAQKHVLNVGSAQRFLSWVIIVLLLPVFTIGFIRAMVRKQSNQVNAFTFAVYAVVDAILAWLLVGATLTSWLPVLVFILCVTAALAYNFFIMNFALKLEE